MSRRAYAHGRQAALTKFALAMPALSQTAMHALELGGLGLVAAPVVHGIIAGDRDESPGLSRLKHTSDLAGLGMLAIPAAMHLLGKH